jgi:hypothetical protein
MLLEDQVFGRDVIFIADHTHLQGKLLRGLERRGGGDEVVCETASQQVARRTGGEKEETDYRENEFFLHSLSDVLTAARLCPADSRTRLSHISQNLI